MKKTSPLALGLIFIAPLATSAPVEEIHLKLVRPNDVFLLPLIDFVIMGALAAFFLIVLAWFSYRAWRSRYAYCPWCGTRNRKDWQFCVKCGARLKGPALTKIQKDWFSMFGWTKNPFTIDVIISKFAGRQAEISLITEKLNTLSGHILVIGGIGTGKTMLLRWLEKSLKNKYETIYAPLPYTSPAKLIDMISTAVTKPLVRIRKYTLDDMKELCSRSRERVLLLLDDMHELKGEYLQLLDTLGNLPNVSLVVAGRPDIREGLKRDLPEFFARIVESILLVALTRAETEEMIRDRIAYAGGKKLGPFSSRTIDEIHIISMGIPRNILKVCDWAVAQAIASSTKMIDPEAIEDYVVQIKQARPHAVEPERR